MVITVQCPECTTFFPVDPAKVPLSGVKARCSSCSAIFRVERPDEAVAPPPAPEVPTAEPGPVPSSEEDLEPEVEPAPGASALESPSWESDQPTETGESESEATAVGEPVEAPASPEDWVFETEEDIDPESLKIEPVGTLEESLETAKEDVSFFGSDLTLEGDVEVEATDEGSPVDSDFAQDAETEVVRTADEFEDAVVTPETERMDEESPPGADHGTEIDAEIMGSVEPAEASPTESATESEPAPETAWETAWDPERQSAPEPQPVTRDTEPSPMETAQPAPDVTGFTFGKRDPHDKARRLARVLVSDIITYNPDRHQRALSAGSLKEDFEEEIEKSWKEYVEQVGAEIANSTPYWSEALNDVLAKGQQIF